MASADSQQPSNLLVRIRCCLVSADKDDGLGVIVRGTHRRHRCRRVN